MAHFFSFVQWGGEGQALNGKFHIFFNPSLREGLKKNSLSMGGRFQRRVILFSTKKNQTKKHGLRPLDLALLSIKDTFFLLQFLGGGTPP